MLPVQCRMARVALNIGVRELAEMAKVSTNTITRFETLDRADSETSITPLKPRTIEAIQAALEAAGVIFIDQNGNGPGVRLRERQ
ncbi:MAG: transcriptional regulator [Brucella anthropi]